MSAVLASILLQAGAPVLRALLESKVKGPLGEIGGAVIDAVAAKLGTASTAEAIIEAHKASPEPVEAAIRQVETDAGWLAYLAKATEGRDALLAREDQRSFFDYGWRPAMSWLVIFLFGWALVVLPLVNAAFRAAIATPDINAIVQFSGLWLVIYGGGHTAKSIWGKS